MQLPVNPASIQITSPNANKTIPIVSLGEINILKDPKLQSISLKPINGKNIVSFVYGA